MPPHLILRGSTYYLIDGRGVRKSLKTDKKGLAEQRLKQYIRGQFGFGPNITVKGWYERWIETKKEPTVRASAIADYKQHWNAYLSSCSLSRKPLSSINVGSLKTLREALLNRGLKMKTVRNIIDSTFRAMWRDASAEGIVETDPFRKLQWPRQPKKKPDPYTIDERERILGWWEEKDFFFFPYVYFQFHTGCRPSETAGLEWRHVDLEAGIVTINSSLVMGKKGATKTEGADRTIPVPEHVLAILRVLPSKKLGIAHVFVGKRGKPMTKKWAEHNWKRCLGELGIRHRKFSATRHTFITEAVKVEKNLKSIADYCGTSVAMIEQNYCARQAVGFNGVATPGAQGKLSSENNSEKLVAGPGFENTPESTTKRLQLANSTSYEDWKKAKSA